MIRKLQQSERMEVPIDRCDVYLNKIRKAGKDLVIKVLLKSVLWVQLVINFC